MKDGRIKGGREMGEGISLNKGLVFHEKYLLHDTGDHPERKERLVAIINFLEEGGLLTRLQRMEARKASVNEVILNHPMNYISTVKSFCEGGRGSLDPDTVVSEESYEVALWAVGGVLEAIDRVLEGRCSSVFCAVRPPGHHALRNRAMGFCLFNNVAIGAKYARGKGVERVLIVDWDAHHGNGTQEAFYRDPTVFYFSTHQWPLYPGTGSFQEEGEGPGRGYTLNCPMPPRSGDEDFIRVYDREFLPRAKDFSPGLILISAGYDGHRMDPLASLKLTTQGFAELTFRISDLSRETHTPVVGVLEGGYNLSALAESVAATIEALP